jgi:hypothetical protein
MRPMVNEDGNDGHIVGQNQTIPWLTALRVLGMAHPYFKEKRGLGMGHLILKYQSGDCKITALEDDKFKVQYLGSFIIVKDRNGDRI